MRALLITTLVAVVASAGAVLFLSLSPAPERPDDSLTLVIETGATEATRTATAPSGGDEATGSLNGAEPASGASEQEQSLDEVIAARLREAEGKTKSDRAASAQGPDATTSDADTAANRVKPDPQNEPAVSAAQRQAATESPPSASVFEGSDNTGSQSDTISMTQLLASELSGGDSGSPGSGNAEQETAADSASEPASEQPSPATANAPGDATPEPANQPDARNLPALANTDDPASMDEAAPADTTIASLDPGVSQQADATEQSSAAPAADARGENQETTTPETAVRQGRPVSHDDAPALPRQRGDFAVNGKITLIIRGLGVKPDLTKRAIDQLPRPVAMAFVPYGEDLKSWTQRASKERHDILLQIPLEPKSYPDTNPGPHTLLTSLSIDENLERLDWLLDRFNGITGVTNYLGGKFASSPGSFAPMLMELKARNLLYVDDRKAANATTRQLAKQVSLAYSVADVVIDETRKPDAIRKALNDLEARAKANGSAIAIGHAHGATLDALDGWLTSLNGKGLVLVPVSQVVSEPPAQRVSQTTGN